MSNGHEVHHHHYRQFHRHKNMFLPMFCRLSIKDIISLNNNHHRKNPISAPASPSSPKVSCMGQVKRSNRIVGFPAVAPHNNRHSKLRNLFSTNKTLFPPTAPIHSAAAGCRSKSFRKLNFKKNECEKQEDRVEAVDIGEIDPPLPVVKRVAPAGVGRDEVNLWRRRSNGAVALKGLQIEQSIITRLPNGRHSIISISQNV